MMLALATLPPQGKQVRGARQDTLEGGLRSPAAEAVAPALQAPLAEHSPDPVLHREGLHGDCPLSRGRYRQV